MLKEMKTNQKRAKYVISSSLLSVTANTKVRERSGLDFDAGSSADFGWSELQSQNLLQREKLCGDNKEYL